MRNTIADIAALKRGGERIAVLTAYDAPSAMISERAGAPVLLVGDSLGMVIYGHQTTLPVTLDMMTAHSAAVVRATERPLVVADLPFLTYADEAQAIASSGRLFREAGVGAVKLEGGGPPISAMVARLTALGMPVMGHLGYTPQSTHQIGVKVQGKGASDARRLIDDALALEAAGAFSIVLELVPAALAAEITAQLTIPTIGIGAGAACDGQVQVWHDILGLFPTSPRHAFRFEEIGAAMEGAVRAYVESVRSGVFPGDPQSARMDPAELAKALR
jgi:3-methyl-2-oxobutanoate hydroxymethyltransferase